MNISNALSFLILGTLMHVAPEFATSLQASSDSVRAMWVEFMSWVITGVGFSYLAREGVVRLPALVTSLIPERMLRPVRQESLPSGARVSASS